jgi:hypothetical protein
VESKSHTETHDCDAAEYVIYTIKDGKERKAIEDVRGSKRSKLTLPAVLWSGLFSARANDKLVKHSGLCVADLDTLNGDLIAVRRQLEGSKSAYTVFVSPGGNGLKAVFRIPADATRHADSFRAIEKHVLELTGKQIDKSGKDLARLCFVSYDPGVYYNPDALELEPLPAREKPKAVASNGALAPDLPLRERIATELLGPLSWSADKGGYFCRCPGETCHRSGTAEKHTIVYLGGAPTLDCQHNSCDKVVGEYNELLRSRIGKAEYKAQTPNGRHKQTKAAYDQGVYNQAEQNGEPKIRGRLSAVEMKPIVYLSKPLWQRATFTLVTGKKNSGKSCMLIHEAARVTRGELGAKDLVIWIALGEDNLAMDVRPRMEAAGADCSKVIVLKWPLVLPRDVAELKLICEEEARVGMIVIDPISGAVPMGANTNLDTDVRKIIEGLNDLAAEIDALIVGVRHLKKSVSGDIIDNVMGSGDWVNVPRVVLACAKDKDDEAIRHIKVVTGNRMPAGSEGLQFRLESAHVVTGGEPVVKAVLLGESCEDINALCQTQTQAPNNKSQQAREVILNTLEAAPGMEMESDMLDAQVAKIAETSVHTVISQRKKLRAEGLIKPVAYRTVESGAVKSWGAKRTNAPRR